MKRPIRKATIVSAIEVNIPIIPSDNKLEINTGRRPILKEKTVNNTLIFEMEMNE